MLQLRAHPTRRAEHLVVVVVLLLRLLDSLTKLDPHLLFGSPLLLVLGFPGDGGGGDGKPGQTAADQSYVKAATLCHASRSSTCMCMG